MAIWKGLSRGQARVLAMSMMGLSRDERAAEMGVTARTVDSHQNMAFRRIGAKNAAEALVMALTDGVVRVVPEDRPGEAKPFRVVFPFGLIVDDPAPAGCELPHGHVFSAGECVSCGGRSGVP